MKKYTNPKSETWDEIIQRPVFDTNDLNKSVQEIIDTVENKGDEALKFYSKKFDKVNLNSLEVSIQEIDNALESISDELISAISLAAYNIEKFHKSQEEQEKIVETTKGVKCWRKSKAIEKVGLYIPGGTAPLFSSILMLAIPAKVAGCKEIILCTPPNLKGEINPAILYTANFVGINKIYKIGGAQAIAAMAYGTQSIPKVYKIFGPGNQYVTKAKELVQMNGTAIDMPAGPSELLVIADNTAIPEFVASDLLSQAEHGIDSQVVLISTSEQIATEVEQEVKLQLEKLPRKEIASQALANSKIVVLNDMQRAFELSNYYAPEHLIIASKDAENYIDLVETAGSVFLGNLTPESAGDYASGTNHTLPTNMFTRSYSGVSLDSFVKKITFQIIDEQGLVNIGSSIEAMAEAEELFAHKNAVTIRLKTLDYGKN
jgi:histidinol dehydrogenase